LEGDVLFDGKPSPETGQDLLAVREMHIGTMDYERLFNTWLQVVYTVRIDGLDPVDEITGGFRPIATTLNAAFDALLRTLPSRKQTSDLSNQSAAGSRGCDRTPTAPAAAPFAPTELFV
jgi:hypothetical protein